MNATLWVKLGSTLLERERLCFQWGLNGENVLDKLVRNKLIQFLFSCSCCLQASPAYRLFFFLANTVF